MELKIESNSRAGLIEQLVAGLVKAGATSGDARMAADMAVHAAEEGVARVGDVIKAVPDPVLGFNVLGVAYTILANIATKRAAKVDRTLTVLESAGDACSDEEIAARLAPLYGTTPAELLADMAAFEGR